jgi:hypothetical protein
MTALDTVVDDDGSVALGRARDEPEHALHNASIVTKIATFIDCTKSYLGSWIH